MVILSRQSQPLSLSLKVLGLDPERAVGVPAFYRRAPVRSKNLGAIRVRRRGIGSFGVPAAIGRGVYVVRDPYAPQ